MRARELIWFLVTLSVAACRAPDTAQDAHIDDPSDQTTQRSELEEFWLRYVEQQSSKTPGAENELAYVSFSDFLESLPEDVRGRFLTDAAREDPERPHKPQVIFGDSMNPESFLLLTDSSAMSFYLDALDEPLSVEWLAALERCLYDIPTADDAFRMRCAALLFRHGRTSGSLYLEAALRDKQDIEAARILAATGLDEYDHLIVHAVASSPVIRADYRDIIDSIRDRQSEGYLDAVLDEGVRQRLKVTCGMGLANLVRRRNIPQELREEYRLELARLVRNSDRYRDNPRSHAVSVAEILWSNEQSEGSIAIIRRGLETTKIKRFDLKHALQAAADSRSADLVPDVMRVVDDLAARTFTDRSEKAMAAETFAIGIRAVYELGGVPTEKQLDAWLGSELGAYIVKWNSTKSVLAFPILRGSISAREALADSCGVEESRRVQSIMSMAPVPRRYLPKSSREWAPKLNPMR